MKLMIIEYHRVQKGSVPALPDSDLPRFLCRVVNSEHIVAVHPDGGHAVGRPSDGDAVTLVLLLDRRGNGVAIIAAETKFEKIHDAARAKIGYFG